MASEEISFKLGLDAKAFQRGLTGIKAQLNDLGTEKWGQFKQMFTVGAMVAGLRELGESMVALRRNAEDVGVSTDFLQSIEKMSVQFGGTAEAGRGALIKLAEAMGTARTEGGAAAEKFARFGISLYDTNGAARTTEEVFKAIADAYKNSSDAATKAALAFEFFGRTGRDINNILGEGADGLDAYAAKMQQFGAVSTASVNAIADAWLNLKQTGSGVGGWLSEMVGRATQGVAFTFANLGALSAGASSRDALNIAAGTSGIVGGSPASRAAGQQATDQAIRDAKTLKQAREELLKIERQLTDATDDDRLRTLKQEALAIEEQITGDKSALETTKLKVELAKKSLEIRKAEEGIQEKQRRLDAERVAMMDKLRDAQSRVIAAAMNLSDAKSGRFKFSLQELAEADPRNFRGGTRQDILAAQEVQRLERMAKWQNLYGTAVERDRLQSLADERRKQIGLLKADEKSPFKALEEALKESAKSLKTLEDQANGKGIKVLPRMGP